MTRLWRVAIALALLTVACRAEANAIVDVSEDGSGQFTIELGMDEEVQSYLGSAEGFVGSIGQLDLTNLDALDQRVEGDMTFYSLTRPFSSVEDLEVIIREQATQEGGSAFDEFDITIGTDGASIVASAPSPIPDTGAGSPSDLASIEQVLSGNVYVTLPGRIVESNADDTIDGRMRWAIDLREGVDIRATTSFSESGFPWLVVGLAAFGVIILGGLGLAMAKRRTSIPHDALSQVEAPPPPSGFESIEG
jgi:hypothetical protein